MPSRAIVAGSGTGLGFNFKLKVKSISFDADQPFELAKLLVLSPNGYPP
jgi:hypothetical protein